MPKRGNSSAKQLANIEAHQFKPGQPSGNPRGRPLGSRNKLSEDFVADLHESWKRLGKATIETVAWTDPSTYLRVVAGLVPKDIEVALGAGRKLLQRAISMPP